MEGPASMSEVARVALAALCLFPADRGWRPAGEEGNIICKELLDAGGHNLETLVDRKVLSEVHNFTDVNFEDMVQTRAASLPGS